MYHGVKSVKPINDYKLIILFDNNEEKIFDMKKHLEYGIFQELKNEKMFNTVQGASKN